MVEPESARAGKGQSGEKQEIEKGTRGQDKPFRSTPPAGVDSPTPAQGRGASGKASTVSAGNKQRGKRESDQGPSATRMVDKDICAL